MSFEWQEYVSAGLKNTGMTKASLADAVGVNPSTVTNWYVRDTQPQSKVVVEVARTFGYSVIEALVVAGHVPESEVVPALMPMARAANPRMLTTNQLLAELRRRVRD